MPDWNEYEFSRQVLMLEGFCKLYGIDFIALTEARKRINQLEAHIQAQTSPKVLTTLENNSRGLQMCIRDYYPGAAVMVTADDIQIFERKR